MSERMTIEGHKNLKISRRTIAIILAVAFAVSFFLRAYQPLSRPRQWLDRAFIFEEAWENQEWARMYQTRHPGFTTMVISGVTLKLYQAAEGTALEGLFTWVVPPDSTWLGTNMAVAVIGLALVISVLLIAITLALKRLGGWSVAITSLGLLIFSPFYLAQSRVVHVDALVSTLMLLSAVLLLIYQQSGQRRYLFGSGIIAGLSLLTKSPSLFLVPYAGLTLLIHWLLRVRDGWGTHKEERRIKWALGEMWREMVLPGLLWLLMIPVVFAFWPAMWVRPVGVLREMILGTEEHVVEAHVNPRYFAGQIYYQEHPSIFFYPVNILFNETFLTVPLIAAAIGHYTLWRKRVRQPVSPVVFWLIVAYPIFFTIQMTIGAKQIERYILPTHLAMSVLVAIGLVGMIEILQAAINKRRGRIIEALPILLISSTIGLQALVTMPFFPDFGAHHNYLLGGNRTAPQYIEVLGQNEGVPDVMYYINDLGADVSLGMTPTIKYTVQQQFKGEWVDGTPPGMDYYLFSLPSLQRRYQVGEWEPVWNAVREYPAELVVSYDGVDQVWLFAAEGNSDTETIFVRRGWTGFIGLAWLWTLAMVGGLVWALRPVIDLRVIHLPVIPVVRPALQSWEWILLLGTLLFGFGLRVMNFTQAPPGVIHDEVRNWLNVQLILNGDIRVLYPYGEGREALYLFLQALSFKLIGDNLLAARLPSIAFNLWGVALSFVLARRLFGRPAGMLAAAGMATSFWALLFSRLAVRTGSMPVFALLVSYLYLRVMDEKRPSWGLMLGASAALGLSLYTYPSALIFPVILAVWLAINALFDPTAFTHKWTKIGASIGLSVLIMIPLMLAWSNPEATGRANEVRGPLDALLAGEPKPVLDNVLPVLSVFSVKGDSGLEFNIQDQPIFPSPLMALLFYAGLVIAMVGIFRQGERRRGYLLAILWLLGMLIPTLVTERPVNPSRTIGLLGIVYMFPAVVGGLLIQAGQMSRQRWMEIGAVVVVIGGIGWQMAQTIPGYFTTWNDNPVVRFLYQDEYRRLAVDLDQKDDFLPTAIGGLTPEEMDTASMRLMMTEDQRADSLVYFNPQSALLIPAGERVEIVIPGFVTLHPALMERLNNWGFTDSSPFGNELYTRYSGNVPPLMDYTPTGNAHYSQDGQRLIILLGTHLVGIAEPGETFTLLTYWETFTPAPTAVRIFVHFTDVDGNIITQSDILGVPTTNWRNGDRFVQTHDFSLPPDISGGPYWVNIGIYYVDSGLRLLTADLPTADYARTPLP